MCHICTAIQPFAVRDTTLMNGRHILQRITEHASTYCHHSAHSTVNHFESSPFVILRFFTGTYNYDSPTLWLEWKFSLDNAINFCYLFDASWLWSSRRDDRSYSFALCLVVLGNQSEQECLQTDTGMGNATCTPKLSWKGECGLYRLVQ